MTLFPWNGWMMSEILKRELFALPLFTVDGNMIDESRMRHTQGKELWKICSLYFFFAQLAQGNINITFLHCIFCYSACCISSNYSWLHLKVKKPFTRWFYELYLHNLFFSSAGQVSVYQYRRAQLQISTPWWEALCSRDGVVYCAHWLVTWLQTHCKNTLLT